MAAGGSEYTNEHTAESVAREPYSEDEEVQAAWREYTATRLAIDIAVQDRTCRAYVDRGVVEDPPDEWLEEQAYWDIEVPDDPRERKWTWLHDVSTGWDEILEIVLAIQGINPIEEIAAAAEAGFRDPVGASDGGEGSDGDSEEAEGSDDGGGDA